MTPRVADVSQPTSNGPARHQRLLLIDGHSLAYRAFHALPVENFSTATGQATNAVYGFVSMLINVLRAEEPDHLAVAFDVARRTFRTDQYEEYKAGRAETPPELIGQIGLIKEVLDALRIRWVEYPGYEADDIIATLTHRGTEAGLEVLISSGDRDCLQLVTDRSTVLYPVRGVSELARLTPEAVLAKYGVPPERYCDLAALVGEKSDNLPGVPGVGPKTAAKWITAHGDLTGLIAAAPTIKGKAGESLRAHLDSVLRNRQLNQLLTDLDLGLDLKDLRRTDWDREAVHQIFDALEFRSLRERLVSTLGRAEPEAEGGFDLVGEVLAPADVAAWLDGHAGPERTGPERTGAGDPGAEDTGPCLVGLHVTVPTPGGPTAGGPAAKALALATHDGAAAHLDLADLPDDAADPARSALAAWLADPRIPKAVHEAKSAVKALAAAGLPLRGLRCDTALAAYLCRPDQRGYDLGDLSLRHLARELRTEQTSDGQLTLDTGDGPDTDEAQAAMVRAGAVLELSAVLDRELTDRAAGNLLQDLEIPLVDVLARMETTGIAVDRGALDVLDNHFAAEVADAAREAFAVIGSEINLGSPKQLQAVLFDDLGMPRTKRIKTGYTTDAEALADLYERTSHPFLLHLLRHRDVSKLRQTVEGLRRSVGPDGRIHTTFHQTIAATGRLSSADPNLQNIPIRTDEGSRIRGVFVVGEGYDCLLTADYSQIEMRIMAHLSGDDGLVEAFRSGEDLHRFVGSRVFGVPTTDVTPAMRSKIKAMSYGLVYGLSPFGLARQLAIPVEEAKALTEDYFLRFGGVRDYLQGVVRQARKDGYTQTILGRRRYLPDLTSDNRQRREMAERMALNAPIQGSAADLIKMAMLRADRALRENGLGSRILLQVHDELVFEVRPGEAETVERLARDAMEGAADLSVPLEVSVGSGRTWQEAAH
ncbi:MAG: polymerase [Actinomycetota bacterium]|nr:polymerase [Actinomycetota bacterium]